MTTAQPIAFVDIETTGMNPIYDRVLEVGIVRLEPDGTVQEYETLIDPDVSISPELTAIHGISNLDIKSAPTFRGVIEDIHELLDGAIFAAHNARFDYSFLKQSFKRLNAPFDYPYVDTVKISRALYPQHRRHSVDALVERFGFEITNRHRALPDAQVLHQFYQHILAEYGHDHVQTIIKGAMARPMIPAALPLGVIDNLPETPGVYIMYDKDDSIAYIGKSKNIKSRVLQHFSADMRESKERKLSSVVVRIDTIPTAGETGALLLESQLVKKHLPLYNRQLRTSHNLVLITKDASSDYHTLKTDILKNIASYTPETILAITKSERSAKELITTLADEHNLCKKILGLEHGPGPCFGHHIARCKGACRQKEPAVLHNLRLELAFSKTKLKSWPLSKPLTIQERDAKTGRIDIFTVDNWCITQQQSSPDGETFETQTYPAAFDYDAYKIICRHLMSSSLSSRSLTQPPLMTQSLDL